jgi:hypothetical protein
MSEPAATVPPVWWRRGLLGCALVGACAMFLPVAAVALEIDAPPSISAAFGASVLGLDGTTPLTFTITNPNTAVALTGIGFTDSLPSQLVVGGTAGAGNTCGGTVTAATGSGSVALSGGQLSAGASCTVTQNVIAVGTGAVTDATTPVTSDEGGDGNAASASITLVGPPVISLLAPASGHTYSFGQKVAAGYSCTDPSGTGISSCVGTLANGALLDTNQPGSQTFTVSATSSDGGVSSQTVFYTVAPNNIFRLDRAHARLGGSISFTASLPGPGALEVIETAAGHINFAHWKSSPGHAGKVKVTIDPSSKGRAALERRHFLHVTVWVTFTPEGGSPRTATLGVEVVS